MKTHELKTWPHFFEPIIQGYKSFEIRKDDRDFNGGDILILKEWHATSGEYTGRQARVLVQEVWITPGLEENYVALSIKLLDVWKL